jgi:hypothetical protein
VFDPVAGYDLTAKPKDNHKQSYILADKEGQIRSINRRDEYRSVEVFIAALAGGFWQEEAGSLLNLFSSQSLTAMACSRVAWKKESMILMSGLLNF